MLHGRTWVTISRSVGLCVCVTVCAVGGWTGGGTTQTASAADHLSQPLLTWQHNKNRHMLACRSCCGLIDIHALSMHICRVLTRCRCLIPAYTQVTNFARFSAAGMGVGSYTGRLIHEYIWYLFPFPVLEVSNLLKVACNGTGIQVLSCKSNILSLKTCTHKGVHWNFGISELSAALPIS